MAFAMIDRMLGGSGRGMAPTRGLTEIEQHVIDGVVKVLLENTLRIADESAITFSKQYRVPSFPLPSGIETENELLVRLAEEGAVDHGNGRDRRDDGPGPHGPRPDGPGPGEGSDLESHGPGGG